MGNAGSVMLTFCSRILLDFAVGQERRDQGNFGEWSRTSICYCQLAPGSLGHLFRESSVPCSQSQVITSPYHLLRGHISSRWRKKC